MDYDENESVNIYSEPLFPISQGASLLASSSSLSTQLTQTQESLAATQLDDRRQNKFSDYGSRKDCVDEDEEEFESDEDSDSSEFSFKLDSMVIRASKLEQDYCTTGCPHLDTALGGGVPTFGITELYGEGGTGKTQLCLQLAITAQLPKQCGGLNAGGVYYICTEDALPTKRLIELVQHFKQRYPTELPIDPMDNIFIERVAEAESLIQTVDIKLAALIRSSPDRRIPLVIIDSVAAVFRTEFDDLSQRTFELRRLAQVLHEYTFDHDAAVVVCNQVTASPTIDGNIASLGMAWKNMITTRILMSKSETNSRNLFVNFSPHAPTVGVAFEITSSGVKGKEIPPQTQK